MERDQSDVQVTELSVPALMRLLGEAFGGYPSLHNLVPAGPWESYIAPSFSWLTPRPDDDREPIDPDWPFPFPKPWEIQFHPTLWRFGPHPEPWIARTRGINWLNPQPLPPRWRIISDIGDRILQAAISAPEGRGAGLAGHFVDDICGNDFRWRWKGPPKPNWWNEEVLATDLIILGTRFSDAAQQLPTGELADAVRAGASRLVRTGIARLG